MQRWMEARKDEWLQGRIRFVENYEGRQWRDWSEKVVGGEEITAAGLIGSRC